VQERDISHQRKRSRAVRAAERRPDRGGDGAVDAGQSAVGDDLAPLPHDVRTRHQVEVADRARCAHEQQPVRWERLADRPGHLVRRQLGLGSEQRVEPGREVLVGRTPAVEPR
jgi:hypothetical protein